MTDSHGFEHTIAAGRAQAAIPPAAPLAHPPADHRIPVGRPGRSLALYPATAGYELQQELDYLSNRVIEPNVFFTGRFLAPAMPRLEDRTVRLSVIRDESGGRSRIRFLMPFSVEKPGFSIGSSIMPDLRLTGAFAQLFRAVAIGRNLPITVTDTYRRPMLESLLDGQAYLQKAISPEHFRELRRQWRKLDRLGELSYNVARQPADIRLRMEEFLLLEAGGWKGRGRTAMINDRYRAAFAREAISNLAETDGVRIHTLDLDGRAIASMIVFMTGGEAYTWKTAYDEAFARYSPGKLLVAELTEWHLDDANIARSDSCAVPDHPVMSRFWEEREDMGTLVVGLQQNRDRDVRQVAAQLHLYRNTRNVARLLRDKIRSLARR
jgi:hypothetical protein